MRIQRIHRVSDGVAGGLVTGDEQQNNVSQQFVGTKRVACLLDLYQTADQIVPRLAAAELDQLAEILLEGIQLDRGFFSFGRREWNDIEHAARHSKASGEVLAIG